MFSLLATLPRTAATARLVLFGIAGGARSCAWAGCSRACCRTSSRSRRTCSISGCRSRSPTGTGSACSRRSRSCSPPIFTCSSREHFVTRVAGATVLPLLAATLYFTFSRASIVVMVVGVIGYVVLARPRGFVPSLIAVLPTTAHRSHLVLRRGPPRTARPDHARRGRPGPGGVRRPPAVRARRRRRAVRADPGGPGSTPGGDRRTEGHAQPHHGRRGRRAARDRGDGMGRVRRGRPDLAPVREVQGGRRHPRERGRAGAPHRGRQQRPDPALGGGDRRLRRQPA